MNRLELALILGLVFGIMEIISIAPQKRDGKRRAILGAFILRFTTCLLIGTTTFLTFPWLQGLVISLLVSLPSAIATRVYIPILIVGILGGAIIGFIIGQWGYPGL